METKVLIIFAVFCAALAADDRRTRERDPFADRSKAIPVQEIPGFWNGRKVQPVDSFHHKFDRDERIVNGNEAKPAQFPYQVGVFIAFDWTIAVALCGGCLVSKNLVISAAHCFENAHSSQVILGTHNIWSQAEPTEVRRIVYPDNLITHPEYDPVMLFNDLTIMRMEEAVEFNDFIQPVELPQYKMLREDFEGHLATVSGWGRMSDNSQSLSDTLRYTQNVVKSNSVCFTYYESFVVPSTMCMNTQDTESGTCSGDSGGPVTIQGYDKPVLVGVVSWGPLAGCQLGMPTGTARVTYFMPWICKVGLPAGLDKQNCMF